MYSWCYALVAFTCLLNCGFAFNLAYPDYDYGYDPAYIPWSRFIPWNCNICKYPEVNYGNVDTSEEGPVDNVDLATSDDLAQKVFSFALKLSQQIGNESRKTLIYSPLSIMSVLAMLLLGAKKNSYTELSSLFMQADMVKLHEQLGLLLNDAQQSFRNKTSTQRQLDPWHDYILEKGFRKNQKFRKSPPEVKLVNGLFLQQGYNLNPDYRQVLTKIYKTEILNVNFDESRQSINAINSWIKQNTNGKIKKAITELSEASRVVIVNTLYFKAMWEQQFLGDFTKVRNFYPNGVGQEPVLSVEIMAAAGKYPYYEDERLKCRIVGLPYHGNLTTMYIIQPIESSAAKLVELQKKLNANAIESMIAQMKRQTALLLIPKMHLTESIELSEELQKMGISVPFKLDRGRTANAATDDALESLKIVVQEQQRSLTGCPQCTDIFIDEIMHKVVFAVDEKGTEAAAASVATLDKSGPQIMFRVETPFILFVRHDLTKLPLFYGVINEPPEAPEDYD